MSRRAYSAGRARRYYSGTLSYPDPPPVDPPPPGDDVVIPLSAFRLDGGSGVTTLSSGIMLQQGVLLPADLNKVALWIGGVEVSCYVEALEGLYAAGHQISVLVQAQRDPALIVNAELRIGTVATQPRLVKNAAAIAVVPGAVLLPTNASYILGVQALPRMAAVADMPAGFQGYDTAWVTWGDMRRGGAFPVYHKWDRALAAFMQWARRGSNATSKEYFKWACQVVQQSLAEAYAATPPGAIVPHNQTHESYAYHYWLTGHEPSREMNGKMAQANGLGYTPLGRTVIYHPDQRIWVRELLSLLNATRINSTGHYQPVGETWPVLTNADRLLKLNAFIDLILAAQITGTGTVRDGFWIYDPNGVDKPDNSIHVMLYMCGLLCRALATCVEFAAASLGATRVNNIQAAIAAYLESVWTQHYGWTTRTFRYETTTERHASTTDPLCGDTQPTSFYHVYTFAWMFRRTGNLLYKARGDRIFSKLIERVNTPGGGVQFFQYTADGPCDSGLYGYYTNDEQAFNEVYGECFCQCYYGEILAGGGSGIEADPEPPPTDPPSDNQFEDFFPGAALDGAKWDTVLTGTGTASVSGGEAVLSTADGNNTAAIRQKVAASLTDAGAEGLVAKIRIVFGSYLEFRYVDPDGDGYAFRRNGDFLGMGLVVANVYQGNDAQVLYDAATMTEFRFVEAGPNIQWSTYDPAGAGDGWTQRHQQAKEVGVNHAVGKAMPRVENEGGSGETRTIAVDFVVFA